VARIIAGIGSSHVPAIGAALDNGKTEEPYWKRVFSGFEKSQEWMRETKPDVAIIVYNDHASAFSVEMIPTFALGCAAEFPPAESGLPEISYLKAHFVQVLQKTQLIERQGRNLSSTRLKELVEMIRRAVDPDTNWQGAGT